MNRRNFLGLSAAAGGLVLFGRPRTARADEGFTGPYWICLHAGGGWDPTVFCDPKGGVAGNKDSVNQAFTPDQIETVGAFKAAPSAIRFDIPGADPVEFYSAPRFFREHGDRFVVFNGVDTTTNNHETGTRYVWSGKPDDGTPGIGAVAAGSVFETRPSPMAFLSYGGYDTTQGVVPLTRAGNIDNLWRIAFPDRIDPKKADSKTFHAPGTEARLAAAIHARLEGELAAATLPGRRRALSTLLSVRAGDDSLERLTAELPANLVSLGDFPDLADVPGNIRGRVSGFEGIARQAQVALAAFKSGVGVAANLSFGGFDTHSDHDNQQTPRMVQLLRGVDYIVRHATELGIADKLYILVGSDFGRTPWYNAGNGKDHWASTSFLVAGPGITGGRVIGATDAAFKPVTIDRTSLQPSTTGVKLTPKAIHAALRKQAGLDASSVGRRYSIGGDVLPLFA